MCPLRILHEFFRFYNTIVRGLQPYTKAEHEVLRCLEFAEAVTHVKEYAAPYKGLERQRLIESSFAVGLYEIVASSLKIENPTTYSQIKATYDRNRNGESAVATEDRL